MDCQQCGNPSDDFDQGVCVDCCAENQQQLDRYIDGYDAWRLMTDTQRTDAIRKAQPQHFGEVS